MGRLIGVRYEDLPETWPGLLAYFDRMVEEELEDTEAAQDVLSSLLDPAAPPLPALRRDWIWRVVRWPSTRAGSLTTLGMLPPTLRDRLGVEWSASRERRFRRLTALARRAGPLMPPPARSFGPTTCAGEGRRSPGVPSRQPMAGAGTALLHIRHTLRCRALLGFGAWVGPTSRSTAS